MVSFAPYCISATIFDIFPPLNRLQSQEFTAVVDMAWGGWIKGRKSGLEMGIPYVRVEAANHPFVKGE